MPRPITASAIAPRPMAPAMSQRRDIRINRLYNDWPGEFLLLTCQREDVPVIAHVINDRQPVPERQADLRVDDALTVGAVRRDRQLGLLVAALAQQHRRGALLELERLGLELDEREVAARQLVERVPRRERRMLELVIEPLELGVDRRRLAVRRGDLEIAAIDLVVRVRDAHDADEREGQDPSRRSRSHMPSTVSCGVTQITVVVPSSSFM